MNPQISTSHIARRDWLKAASLGGAASILTSTHSRCETPDSTKTKVRGVVFMVSDGMSPGVLTLAEVYSKITRNQSTRWWQLLQDKSAAGGLMDTASASSWVTDSAAASSAWGGGQRVKNGEINVDASGREITPIASILKKNRGANIGLVTTATVTHATPAGFATSVSSRGDEGAIAEQYLNRVDVILGGGKGYFDPKQRRDQRDLAGEFANAGYACVSNRDDLLASRSEKLLGTFTAGHLPFSIDRDHDPELAKIIPTLAEMSMAVLDRFLASDKPFLLQIEGARIDHAAHANDIAGLLGDQLAFDDAMAAVLAKTSVLSDILVIVTSDHGNANPGLNGTGDAYGQSNPCFKRVQGITASHEKIFSQWRNMKDADVNQLSDLVSQRLGLKLETSEAEALFDMFNKEPVIEWSHQLEKPEGLLGQFVGNHTGIGWTGTSHTSDPTLVSALGPQSDRFSGLVINTEVFTHLVEMLG